MMQYWHRVCHIDLLTKRRSSWRCSVAYWLVLRNSITKVYAVWKQWPAAAAVTVKIGVAALWAVASMTYR